MFSLYFLTFSELPNMMEDLFIHNALQEKRFIAVAIDRVQKSQ